MCRQIIAYDCIADNNIMFVRETVNNGIEKGWQPMGGVVTNHIGIHLQIMVKYAPEPIVLPAPRIAKKDYKEMVQGVLKNIEEEEATELEEQIKALEYHCGIKRANAVRVLESCKSQDL